MPLKVKRGSFFFISFLTCSAFIYLHTSLFRSLSYSLSLSLSLSGWHVRNKCCQGGKGSFFFKKKWLLRAVKKGFAFNIGLQFSVDKKIYRLEPIRFPV
jgi:hypothetical protein